MKHAHSCTPVNKSTASLYHTPLLPCHTKRSKRRHINKSVRRIPQLRLLVKAGCILRCLFGIAHAEGLLHRWQYRGPASRHEMIQGQSADKNRELSVLDRSDSTQMMTSGGGQRRKSSASQKCKKKSIVFNKNVNRTS